MFFFVFGQHSAETLVKQVGAIRSMNAAVLTDYKVEVYMLPAFQCLSCITVEPEKGSQVIGMVYDLEIYQFHILDQWMGKAYSKEFVIVADACKQLYKCVVYVPASNLEKLPGVLKGPEKLVFMEAAAVASRLFMCQKHRIHCVP